MRPFHQWRQALLLVSAAGAFLLALYSFVPSFVGGGRVSAAPAGQQSPLSPLVPAGNDATALTTTVTATNTLTDGAIPLIPTVVLTESQAVTTAPPATDPVPGTVASPLAEPTAAPEAGPSRLWQLRPQLASGQISLVLVGVLFVGLFTVIGLVLARRRS
jgi:hypothetical protein